MTFPYKFKHLIEKGINDVDIPDYLYLVWGVCGTDENSCAWEGWMLEAVFKKSSDSHPTSTGDRLLKASDDLICPRCGKPIFRTSALIKMNPAEDQRPVLIEGQDYVAVPIEYK